jgi:hypothetical protein
MMANSTAALEQQLFGHGSSLNGWKFGLTEPSSNTAAALCSSLLGKQH